jgi:hypothetical protein
VQVQVLLVPLRGPGWKPDRDGVCLVTGRVQVPPGSLEWNVFDNQEANRSAYDVAVACRLAMAEVRVRLPLGALVTVPNDGSLQTLWI